MPSLRGAGYFASSFWLLGFLFVPAVLWGASKAATVADMALYKGSDREKILIEGGKKEGQLALYTSNSVVAGVVSQSFEKKYPFIKVSSWTAESPMQLRRVLEENRASRYLADVMESSPESLGVLQRENLLQDFYSPELAAYGEELKDLLEPKFKGNIGISGHSTGARWVGAVLDMVGMDYLERLARQDVRIHNVAGPAMRGLVAAGEVPVTPTISDSNIMRAKRQGAPVDWRPMEPVMTNVGYSAMFRRLPHPHAALLFLDYLHSKEGQQIAMKEGVSSPRSDLASHEMKFKKTYLESKYTIEELEKKIGEWDAVLRKLFLRRQS